VRRQHVPSYAVWQIYLMLGAQWPQVPFPWPPFSMAFKLAIAALFRPAVQFDGSALACLL